jgi:twitching motility protein PilT
VSLPLSPVSPALPGPEGTAALTALYAILRLAVARGASDVHLRAGTPPFLRVSGELWPLERGPLGEAEVEALVLACLQRDRERQRFESHQESDFALDVPNIGRFRGSAYRTRGSAAVVLRIVNSLIPTLDELGLPPQIAEFTQVESGLILIVGPTGSGKSTTLASMVNAINYGRRCHILTIEDPIEFLLEDVRSTVSQREVGTDTDDFASALRSGLRQDPDVILVGEIRDLETMRTAIQASETGHLVLASMHARTVSDAVHRVIDFFPFDEQRQVRSSLAQSLVAVVAQRLLMRADGSGRVPAAEILVNTARVQESISDPERGVSLSQIIEEGNFYGMCTLQQDLIRLLVAGSIELTEAERFAPHVADLRLALKRTGITTSQQVSSL